MFPPPQELATEVFVEVPREFHRSGVIEERLAAGRTAPPTGCSMEGPSFDREGNLYVGDRTGSIFKINPDRQIFVFATMEPSVAAYHLAFNPDGQLYITGPTTSSFDHVYRVSPAGEVASFYRGLGRPQGLAFDAKGNLYVAASLGGRRGVVRLTPDAEAELIVSGIGIVGLAFTPHRSVILATNSSLIELFLDIEGMPLLP